LQRKQENRPLQRSRNCLGSVIAYMYITTHNAFFSAREAKSQPDEYLVCRLQKAANCRGETNKLCCSASCRRRCWYTWINGPVVLKLRVGSAHIS